MNKNILSLLVSLALCPAVFAGQRVELAADWLPNPTSQAIFDLPQGYSSSDLPFFYRIKQKVLEKDWEIESIDLDKYREHLKATKKKRGWNKIKDLLGMSPGLDKEVAYLVLWNLCPKFLKYDFSKFPQEKLILFLWEPPSVEPHIYEKKLHQHFSKIFTWDDDLVDNKKYFKFYYPVLQKMREDIPAFEQKKLCTLISSNLHSQHPNELYSKREEVILFFEEMGGDDFEFYGRKWEGCGYKNYKGAIEDKGTVLKNYRFAICYENIKEIRGYVTEKIFDCFACGVVPVYWGASNIEDYVPSSCFIDQRKFSSNEELYAFLKKMPKEEYEGYLERIKNFLQSEKASLFSQENFLKTFDFAISKDL
jgi:alpha(1,3/1,4) fucosyltransferase